MTFMAGAQTWGKNGLHPLWPQNAHFAEPLQLITLAWQLDMVVFNPYKCYI